MKERNLNSMNENEKSPESDVYFQRYSNDKFLSTKQSDIETSPLPALRILRSTATKILDKKLRKIFND
jgi:hypothetical protein